MQRCRRLPGWFSKVRTFILVLRARHCCPRYNYGSQELVHRIISRFYLLSSFNRFTSAASQIFSGLFEEGTVRPHPQIHGEGIFRDGKTSREARGKTRCILVHNQVLVRQGLRRLLEDDPEVEVVAEAGDAAETLQRVLESRPDVVLADTTTIELPADELEQLILRGSPSTRVLFLGIHEGDVQLGGPTASDSAYVPPHTSAKELVAMVKGHADMPRGRVHEMPSTRDREWFPGALASSKKRGLTSREREVLKLLAEGQTVRSAAGVLGLSAKTVDAHKFNLMRKLGIHNKAELVMWAIQKKVVKLPVNL